MVYGPTLLEDKNGVINGMNNIYGIVKTNEVMLIGFGFVSQDMMWQNVSVWIFILRYRLGIGAVAVNDDRLSKRSIFKKYM